MSAVIKGILDGCILQIIKRKETYGYKITEELNEKGFYDLNEGTVYPILVRLEKKGLISSSSRVSPLGPRRKYFKLSEDGSIYLNEFKNLWDGISASLMVMFIAIIFLVFIAIGISTIELKQTKERVKNLPEEYKKVYLDANEIITMSTMTKGQKRDTMVMVLEIFEHAAIEKRNVYEVIGLFYTKK